MRICVLGQSGMLGHVAARYLSEKQHQIIVLDTRLTWESIPAFCEALQNLQAGWLVNCMGAGPRNASGEQLFQINSLVPLLCVANLPRSTGIIQPSTDGVFDPGQPERTFSDFPDALDDYGLSKRCAEAAMQETNRCVIRCSIIGPELAGHQYLWSWFLSEEQPVQGYTNHYWNGITTLEWAKICEGIVQGKYASLGNILQPGIWPPVTKSGLLSLLGKLSNHPVKVNPVEAKAPLLRSLVPNILCPSLENQIRELKAWYPQG